jgi:glutamate/tyrosine decarboxylase-like PLP-dependent enzyme
MSGRESPAQMLARQAPLVVGTAAATVILVRLWDKAREKGLARRVMPLLCDYVNPDNHGAAPVVRLASPQELEAAFAAEGCAMQLLETDKPASEDELLEAVKLTLHHSVRSGSPYFFNQLYARVELPSLVGDWVSTAVNANVHTYEVAPVFTLMEKHCLARMARAIGPTFAASHDGLFVPGGSIGNLYGMHLARNRAMPKLHAEGACACPPLVAFVSEEAHYSYLKTARLLGIGSNNLVSVKTDATGAMLPEALEQAIQKAKTDGKMPFFIGATSGTTVLGSFDPLRALAGIRSKHGMWMHVDGAWGGGSLFSQKLRHTLDGCDLADSFSISAHKMLGAALQCAVFVTQHAGSLKAANATSAAYLFQKDKLNADLDLGDKTIQCGRKSDMLKLWMLFKSLGDAGVAARIDRCYHMCNYAAEKMRKSNGAFVLAYEPSCTNLNFWYVPKAMRPLPPMTELGVDHPIKKVAPHIKAEMQRKSIAMIGFQSVRGLPNFFRWVFPCCAEVEERHIDEIMRNMELFGEQCSA